MEVQATIKDEKSMNEAKQYRMNMFREDQIINQKRVLQFGITCINPYINFMHVVSSSNNDENLDKVSGLKKKKDKKTGMYRYELTKTSFKFPFAQYIRMKSIFKKKPSAWKKAIVGKNNSEEVRKMLKKEEDVKLPETFMDIYFCDQRKANFDVKHYLRPDFAWLSLSNKDKEAISPPPCGAFVRTRFGTFKKGLKMTAQGAAKAAKVATSKQLLGAGAAAAGLYYRKPIMSTAEDIIKYAVEAFPSQFKPGWKRKLMA